MIYEQYVNKFIPVHKKIDTKRIPRYGFFGLPLKGQPKRRYKTICQASFLIFL